MRKNCIEREKAMYIYENHSLSLLFFGHFLLAFSLRTSGLRACGRECVYECVALNAIAESFT